MPFNILTSIIRGIRTSSILHELIKLPIQVTGIEGRYAAALYSAASKQGTLDAVESELIKLQETIKVDEPLREFMADPTLKRKEKANSLKLIAEKLAMGPLTSNMLQLLAENGRLKKLSAVINSYRTVMSAHKGEVECEIISAKELEQANLDKLKEVLKLFVGDKQTVHITTTVNPHILGGLVVTVGDRFIDLSVATKINRYVNIMSQPL